MTRTSSRPYLQRLLSVLLLLSFVASSPTLFAFPPRAYAAATVIFLTSGTSWTVPDDWNSSNNTIEVIGGGGGGPNNSASARAGAGGGGGGYSKSSNVQLTPNTTVSYSVMLGVSWTLE